ASAPAEPPSGPAKPPGDDDAPRPARPVAQVVLAALLGVCVVAGIVFAYRLGVFPTKYLAPAIAADIVVCGLIGYGLVRTRLPKSKARFALLALLAAIGMVANLGVAKVSDDVSKGIKALAPPTTVTVHYDIIGLKTGPSDVSALTGTLMGDLVIDPNAAQARTAVLRLVDVGFTAEPDDATLAADLGSGAIGSAVLIDDYLRMYAEYSPDFYDTVKILASFDIQVDVTPPTPTPGTIPSPGAEETPPLKPNPAGTFVVYISGIDTYGPVATVARSDVNQLMVVNTNTGKVLLVNTPRDYYVQLHGTTGLKDKLTHAGVYGIAMSVQTMQDLYGLTIDYYLRINFDSLTKLVDAVGGIDVNSSVAFSAQGYTFVKGMNHMNGDQALAFARDRHHQAGGDRGRGLDQQAIIAAIIAKAKNPAVLANYPSILSAMSNSMQTSMPRDTMTGLAKTQLATGTDWQISTYAVNGTDGSEYTHTYAGQKLYVMIPIPSTVETAKQKIAATLGS
ncbi:MAG: LCP family protein, partial [Actinomycetia bacterium]|nr:LCP family protein [Actinomycetes bacterium]